MRAGKSTMIDTTEIGDVLRHGVGRGDVPGVVAAVATRDGVLFEGAFGRRDITGGTEMTPDTVLWIASLTKAVTAAAAMQLVEQGRLALDAPIAGVLPELGRVQVLAGFDAAGAPILRAPARPITLRHLLTHTAGFGYDMWNADIKRYLEVTASSAPADVSRARRLLATPLTFDPGDRWQYGINIDWAGRAVEVVSGQRLGDYMRVHIFEPLGMADTGFRIGGDQRRRLARIHNRTAEGLVPSKGDPPAEPEFDMGGGGLYGTVSDYLRFARMILGGGELEGRRVLGAETVALMSRNGMGDTVCRPMISAVRGASNDVQFVDGMQWGLSFMINPAPLATGRSAGSLAWAGLANSFYWIDPEQGVAGVYSTQVLPFCDARAFGLFQEFETAVYGAIRRVG